MFKFSVTSSFCTYCKKAISPNNEAEFTQGYHDECHKVTFEYRTKYNNDVAKFLSLKEQFPLALNTWTFEDTLKHENLSLDLQRMNLSSLPKSIDLFKNIAQFDLNHNKLSSLPEDINNLKDLNSLILSYNNFEVFPDLDLKNLETFNINHNQLTTVPSSITKLSKLKFLDISFNKLTELPVELHQLTSLTWLESSNNSLTELSMDNLPEKLDYAGFSSNKFTHFPECIGKIKPISIRFDNNPIKNIPSDLFTNNTNDPVFLDFNNCGLSSLPDTLSDVNIHALAVSNNTIKSLPDNFGQNKYIRNIDLSLNPISKLPDHFHVVPDSWLINLNDTKIHFLSEFGITKQLHLKNTPLSEFPNLLNTKKMELLDIRGTNIDKIPEYVKNIEIEEAFISDSKLKGFFNSKCRVIID